MSLPADRCGLRYGALGSTTVHLCVDMQAMFADPASPWHVPWMMRVLPNVERIARRHPDRTIFTRFLPLPNADAAQGSWRGYYRHWHAMTRDAIDPAMIDLLPSLVAGAPEAEVLDKTTYGPW